MKSKISKIIFSLSLVAFVLPAAALADQVTDFHADVNITSANTVNITETIRYDPEGVTRHGIFRFVPAKFQDAQGHNYYTSIKFDSVTDQNGHRYQIAEQHNNRTELYLKIGNPDVTFTDPHTYIIKYLITPLALRAGDHDRLILNLTGQQWSSPINQVTADLVLPADVRSAQCFTGPTGSTAHDCQVSNSGNRFSVTTFKPLNSNEGMTVDVNLPPNSFTQYLEPDQPLPLTQTEKIELALIISAALVWAAALVRLLVRWLADWGERRAQTVIPLYEPPDGLKPAQMSVLDSPRSDVADIAATIIDLAVRGYLKVEQLQSKTWYRKANYRLTKLKDGTDLVPFETELFNGLFSAGATLELKDIKSKLGMQQSLSMALHTLRYDLGKDLKQRGYYVSSPTVGWPVARFVVIIVTAIVLIVGTAQIITNGANWEWAVGALIGAIATWLLCRIRTNRTLAGNQERAKVEGFKWFLKVTEKDRLAFTDAPEKTPELFSKMLPYAIALKVEKQWAKQFEGIDVSQTIGIWYVGSPGDFSSSAFASDFSSSFGGAISTSFAGSGGSGGAGGGGGGGGGGGW